MMVDAADECKAVRGHHRADVMCLVGHSPNLHKFFIVMIAIAGRIVIIVLLVILVIKIMLVIIVLLVPKGESAIDYPLFWKRDEYIEHVGLEREGPDMLSKH